MVPQNEGDMSSSSGEQRHYGAVELPGVGQPVYVNDVVGVLLEHSSLNSEKGRYHLSQVRRPCRRWTIIIVVRSSTTVSDTC